jgi:hypothetical protein
MQGKTRTAAVLLIGALLATGCANRTANSPGTSIDIRSAATVTTTTSSTTTTTGATAPEAELVEPAGLPATPTTTSTSTTVPGDPAIAEIDSLLAGLDETLAELDQLLNQAAAALAAEEGEILP